MYVGNIHMDNKLALKIHGDFQNVLFKMVESTKQTYVIVRVGVLTKWLLVFTQMWTF